MPLTKRPFKVRKVYMTSTEHATAQALSQEYFRDPNSYNQLTLTRSDNKIIVGCIDPREIDYPGPTHHKVSIQTAGAGAGIEMDSAIADIAASDAPTTMAESLQRDKRRGVWKMYVIGGHIACKFVLGGKDVLEEMRDPSDFTEHDVEISARTLGFEDIVTPKTQKRVRWAAGVLLEEEVRPQGSLEHLLPHIDHLHPERDNIVHMQGENIAQIYVKNFLPYMGIDRARKPFLNAHLVQGYHDSVAATAVALRMNPALTEQERALRLNAMLLRSAATQTVLTRGSLSDMTFLHVHPSASAPKGLTITEVNA